MLLSHPGGRRGPGFGAGATLAGRPLRRLLAVLVVLLGIGPLALMHAHPAAADGYEAPSLSAFANSPGWVTLSWTHSGSGVYYFVIEQESPYGVMYADADKRAWTVTGLAADTTYRYHVCAVYDYNRVCSDYVTVRTMSAARPAPSIPADAASFRMADRPDLYMRHSFNLGQLTPVTNALDRSDATFVMRPGLSGTPGSVSFEALNYRGHYLRHNFWRIKLHAYDGTDLFRKDASFVKRPGTMRGSIRFESVNYPGYFINARYTASGFAELWIDKDDVSRNSSSWAQESARADSCVRWDGPCPA